MTTTQELVFLHLWLVLYVIGLLRLLRRGRFEENYRARTTPFYREWFPLPRRLGEKEGFARFSRLFLMASLPFVFAVYALSLWRVMGRL